MARKPRIHFSGAFYHVMLRGNGGQDIFFSSEDQTRLYLLLQEGAERFGHRIHAFCFMENHVHMVIHVGVIPLSKIIQNLSFRYTHHINTVLSRTGHLFQGRYKAIMIDADNYLLELVRYIHNNPVRAGITKKCADYKWSSHGTYCGEAVIPWLTTDWILHQFSEQAESAHRLYIDFISQGSAEKQRSGFEHGSFEGRLLGNKQFVEGALARTEERLEKLSLDQIIEAVCAVYEMPSSMLAESSRRRKVSEARAMAALLVLDAENLTLTNLSVVLRRELSGLSQAAGRLGKRLQHEHILTIRLDEIKKQLTMHNCQAMTPWLVSKN